jgi:hypothetical protein
MFIKTKRSILERKNIKMMNKTIKTALMEDATANYGVEVIINILKDIEVDGETMQYILYRVGMEKQMLKQLNIDLLEE